MTAIPTKLYEAFEKIRLGKVEEGTRLFDRVDGFEDVKAIPLAELSYFRHDWKRGMQFSFDFLASETDWEPVYRLSFAGGSLHGLKRIHLALIVVATCQLGCWKESRDTVETLKKITVPNHHKGWNLEKYQITLSHISDPANTARRLTESKPELRAEGKIDSETLERKAKNAVPKSIQKHWRKRSFDDLIGWAYSEASTEIHLAFYERYAARLEKAKSHQEAAKSYIALDNLLEAKEAIRQYMRCWEFKEPFQVAPIELFADPELWTIMSDRRFTESLLAIPHHRES